MTVRIGALWKTLLPQATDPDLSVANRESRHTRNQAAQDSASDRTPSRMPAVVAWAALLDTDDGPPRRGRRLSVALCHPAGSAGP